MFDTLEGSVERVTYFNEENGYSVLRLAPHGQDYLVTVVGNLPEINPGEYLRLQGAWTTHAQYGKQFKAETCQQVLPATVEGIRKYLGSGLVKGVGPVMADRIVRRFGLQTLDVIESEPQRLQDVLGIGPKRIAGITRAWQEQKSIKEVMVFLQSHGVSTGLAVKIYKQYGDAAIDIVTTDPYRLANEIRGIGFKTADKIARHLGIPPDAPSRIEAGVAYTLSELADEGHVYAPQPELVAAASQLLEVSPEVVTQAIERLGANETVHIETLPVPAFDHGGKQIVREEQAVYLTPFYYGEIGVTNRVRGLLEAPEGRLPAFGRIADWEKVFARLQRDTSIELSERQKEAIQTALTQRVTILTGGPGTGKTTALRSLIRALDIAKYTYLLASPTGRAAKRLSEATGQPARTIHRLLEFSPTEGFSRNADNPLEADMVVVDEASMLDLLLTNQLLKAIAPGSHLLLVGDIDQLPSVGAGEVLRDLIDSGQAAVVRLDIIFRQAADSLIVTNAHRIRHGEIPLTPRTAADFFLFPEEDPEKAAELVVDLVAQRIPRKFGLDPLNDIMILSPMHRGLAGVAALNGKLQARLNPPGPKSVERAIGGRVFRLGDRVMQIQNDYDREVFNGDIGRVAGIDLENQTLTASIDGRRVVYDWSDLDELVHAYAISIHKSQGSEYPCVVIPLLPQHYMMLQRNLLYTAVTRARRLVVLVGSRRAIAMAVKNDRVAERHSALAVRLARAGQAVR